MNENVTNIQALALSYVKTANCWQLVLSEFYPILMNYSFWVTVSLHWISAHDHLTLRCFSQLSNTFPVLRIR